MDNPPRWIIHHDPPLSHNYAAAELECVVTSKGELEIVDLGPQGPKYRKKPKPGLGARPNRVKKFSSTEWQELERQSSEMSTTAPASIEVVGVLSAADVDAGSDASGAEDLGCGAGAVLPEASAPPAQGTLGPAVGFGEFLSLVQIKAAIRKFVPAPAVALMLGGVFYSLPGTKKVVTKVGKAVMTAAGSVMTGLEWNAQFPDWFWAMGCFLLGLLYLLHPIIGLDVIANWLYGDDDDADRRRRLRERDEAERLASHRISRGRSSADPHHHGDAAASDRDHSQAWSSVGACREPVRGAGQNQ